VRRALVAFSVLALSGGTATAAPLAIQYEPDVGSVLARVDPLTLAPRGPRFVMQEYHDSWSYSPGGRRLVLGTSAGGPAAGRGIHIVDVTSLEELSTIQVPSAVEALAWLSRRRIAGAVQGDTVFVADPVLGRLVVKRTVGGEPFCAVHPPAAAARHRLVLLIGHSLVTVGSDMHVRRARLRGLPDVCSGADLVVDRARGRAFVAGAGPDVADVDLRTMRVRALRLSGPAAGPGYTIAVWLGRRGLIAAGHTRGSSLRPAGVELIDTRARRRTVLERRASGVVRAGRELLAFGGKTGGVRAFSLAGSPRWRTLRGRWIREVHVLRGRAYAIGPRGLAVIDLRTHRVVHRSRKTLDGIQFLNRP
jgi:hypothetical protein